MQAYCVKCRKEVEIKNPEAMTMKNKRPATQGVLSQLRRQGLQDRQGLRQLRGHCNSTNLVNRQQQWDCDNINQATFRSGLTLNGTGAVPSK